MDGNSKHLEARVFRGNWMDGALDVSAGAALVVTGVFWLTGPTAGQTLAPVLAFVLYPILRSKITEPRIGHVRFAKERRAKLRMAHWIMLSIGVAALGIGIGFYFLRRDAADSDLARTLVPGLPAALVGLMAIGGAIMLGLSRFLVYAAALIIGGVVVILMDAHPGWALLAGGIVATWTGLCLMLQFVREYPVVNSVME